MEYIELNEFERLRREIYRKFISEDKRLLLKGIEVGAYHVVVDPHDIYLNAECSICRVPCETGGFMIKKNKEPVCQRCGDKYK